MFMCVCVCVCVCVCLRVCVQMCFKRSVPLFSGPIDGGRPLPSRHQIRAAGVVGILLFWKNICAPPVPGKEGSGSWRSCFPSRTLALCPTIIQLIGFSGTSILYLSTGGKQVKVQHENNNKYQYMISIITSQRQHLPGVALHFFVLSFSLQ